MDTTNLMINNNTIPKFICLIGPAGSGKSTKAAELAKKYDAIILSSDSMRKKLYGDETDQTHNSEVFNEIHRQIIENVKNHTNIIFDATNLIMKKRIAMLRSMKNIPIEKIAIIVATDYEICLENNRKRTRQVPDCVIKKHIKAFQCPYYYEGWDKIIICRNGANQSEESLYKEIKTLQTVPQDNPHHSLTIGNHCIKCNNECKKILVKSNLSQESQQALLLASYFHDVGKGFCKEFKNSKGETTDIAHYYGHNSVSAYKSLCSGIGTDDNESLHIATLIQWHMEPYTRIDNSLSKFYNLIGTTLEKGLTVLHESDQKAH